MVELGNGFFLESLAGHCVIDPLGLCLSDYSHGAIGVWGYGGMVFEHSCKLSSHGPFIV